MKLEIVRVNDDGSADATVEFGPGELEAFARIGIIHALEAAINSDKAKWPPEGDLIIKEDPCE
jgi:hypothetical protein